MANVPTGKTNSTHRCVPPHNKKTHEYTAYYNQQYQFDSQGLGNMTLKASSTASTPPRLLGDPLDYQLNYEYEPGFAHRASRIGNQYYRYDLNGSVTEVRDGPFEAAPERTSPVVYDLGDKTYYTEGGWALNEPKAGGTGGTPAKTQKEYRWDDKNRLAYSNDGRYSVRYTYGEDGERTGKWAVSNMGGESESLYFGKLWSWHYDGAADNFNGMNSKHIFVGETRIATKVSYADGSFIAGAERQRQYYYHSDHLGSAQLVTDWQGQEYERFEYTPYGELWIEKAAAASALDVPYRFTGKERDKETGLYYYGARYLDPRESRWLSVDPAMGEYVPSPGQDAGKLPGMGGVFNTVNLHVYHYAGNNPVKYVDPDGKIIEWEQGEGVSNEDFATAQEMGERIKNSDTEAGKRWRAIEDSDKILKIHVNNDGINYATPGDDTDMSIEEALHSVLGIGGDAFIEFDPNNCELRTKDPTDAEATLAHEVSGHGYMMISGSNPWTRKGRERDASAIENQYRSKITGSGQRGIYDTVPGYQWPLPQYNGIGFTIFGTDKKYDLKK